MSETTHPSLNDGRRPRRVLSLLDAVCIIVGTIIGAGIFKMPGYVAANLPNVYWLAGIWIFGGLVALIGALCFAELTTCYPDRGGDYGYLKRAYHHRVGFAFSWAAFWIIRPGSIGSMAMICGDFLSEIFPWNVNFAGNVFAAISVVLITLVNLLGIRIGKTSLNLLTFAKVFGILLIILAAFSIWSGVQVDAAQAGEQAAVVAEETVEVENEPASVWSSFWLAMVFVMFAYGGWNDIAFVATEVKHPRRNLLGALVIGTTCVVLIYLLVNFALVMGLGFNRMAELGRNWQDVTSVLVSENMGDFGLMLFAVLVAISCLGAMNAMIFTSPRIYSATALDYPQLSWLAATDDHRGWWRAMLLQMIVTLMFIGLFGFNDQMEFDQQGIENIVVATAPYFWSFLALTVMSLVVCRWRYDKQQFSGFRVPLFPLFPLFFTAACLFMTYRGWVFMAQQELWIPTVGIAVWMLVGIGLSFALKSRRSPAA
ncbi:MAG: amino acid permease [Planctomycetota bacterium]|nr:amino acid permease [Planctomycetota bacterium]